MKGQGYNGNLSAMQNVGTNTNERYEMNKSKSTLIEFLKEIDNSFQKGKTLILNLSTFKTFDSLDFPNSTILTNEEDLNSNKNYFDFVIGDLPFGLNRVESILPFKLKINRNWNFLYKGLKKLSNNGLAFFLIEPSILFTNVGKSYLAALEKENYYYKGAFNVPEKLFYPQTSFRPILISFSRNQTTELFISELNADNTKIIAENYLLSTDSNNIETGIIVNKLDFESFNKYKIKTQIQNLKTQYKDYENYKISDISVSINLTREQFEFKENCIYIPKIGNSQVVSSITDTKIKHQNYFQVELNPNFAIADYLKLFYKSQLGRLILSSLNTGTFIPHINKSDIAESLVALPNITEQKVLVHTNGKLEELQQTIDNLQLELSLNPKNTDLILEKFDSIQGPLKSLSQEDEILSLIRKGEGKIIEFKQTFSKNIRTNNKDKEIEKSSLKNIVGFLNAEGGTLLIGVSDNGIVTGIEDDFFKTNDKYLLHFKNLINSKIGSEFYPLIDYDIFTVLDKKVLKVNCKASNEPCFYEDNEFYVRTNPATDRLEGRKQMEYIKSRFK
jgi:schlafen family protein/N-6 DNA methylase